MNIKRSINGFFLCFLLLACLSVSFRANAAQMDSGAGIVSIRSGWLNVRSSPDSTAARVTTLQKGTHVTLLSQKGEWWYIEYAPGKYGYCHSDYISPVSSGARKVNISSGYLNVRTGPGTGYARAGSLGKGEIVLELSSSGGWSRILWQGSKIGYVSDTYLTSSGFEKIQLRISDLKQMDKRWAEEEVAASGKTFAQIGCATTAIAMMESYRSGATILPPEMENRLRYTPGGNVYWPGDYRVTTSFDGYLEQIYRQLQQGKPVLLGARNSYGKQHWVVVTGFSGGNALTASAFTVNDPGTVNRSNLQQFLNQYPNLYKLFTY